MDRCSGSSSLCLGKVGGMPQKTVLDKLSIYIPQSKICKKPVERLLKLGEKKDRSVNYLVVEAVFAYLDREENADTRRYLTTKEVADRFSAEVSLVRLWCQNGLIRADKRKNYWRIDGTALENPHPILQRRLANSGALPKRETDAPTAKSEHTAGAKARRSAIYIGFYRCPKCRQGVRRTDVDWLDELRQPGSKPWEESGKLQCTHCGYETELTPRLRRNLDLCAYQEREPIRQSVRKLVLEEAGHKCEECGATDDLHLHHIRASCMGGRSEAWNLKVLCRNCHMKEFHV